MSKDIQDLLNMQNVKVISPNDQIWQRVEELENKVQIQGHRITDLENKIRELEGEDYP